MTISLYHSFFRTNTISSDQLGKSHILYASTLHVNGRNISCVRITEFSLWNLGLFGWCCAWLRLGSYNLEEINRIAHQEIKILGEEDLSNTDLKVIKNNINVFNSKINSFNINHKYKKLVPLNLNQKNENQTLLEINKINNSEYEKDYLEDKFRKENRRIVDDSQLVSNNIESKSNDSSSDDEINHNIQSLLDKNIIIKNNKNGNKFNNNLVNNNNNHDIDDQSLFGQVKRNAKMLIPGFGPEKPGDLVWYSTNENIVYLKLYPDASQYHGAQNNAGNAPGVCALTAFTFVSSVMINDSLIGVIQLFQNRKWKELSKKQKNIVLHCRTDLRSKLLEKRLVLITQWIQGQMNDLEQDNNLAKDVKTMWEGYFTPNATVFQQSQAVENFLLKYTENIQDLINFEHLLMNSKLDERFTKTDLDDPIYQNVRPKSIKKLGRNFEYLLSKNGLTHLIGDLVRNRTRQNSNICYAVLTGPHGKTIAVAYDKQLKQGVIFDTHQDVICLVNKEQGLFQALSNFGLDFSPMVSSNRRTLPDISYNEAIQCAMGPKQGG